MMVAIDPTLLMNNRIDLNEFNLHDHCYSLFPAKTTPKVTIRHQQERAAKLAELLRSEYGDKAVVYWVIGAGAAGLTFGATMCRDDQSFPN